MVPNSKPATVQVMRRQASDASPARRSHTVRALNPAPAVRRQPSLKRMVALGSIALDRILKTPALADDDALRAEVLEVWQALALAWKTTRGDQRVALTRLQELLRAVTAEDAFVADDLPVQRYRRQLHQALDH